jgi:chorismate mutase
MTTSLAEIRAEIDRVDGALAQLIEQRLGLAEAIGRLKAETRTVEMDEARQTEILRRLEAEFPELGPLEIESIWRVLFSLSIARQLAIISADPT